MEEQSINSQTLNTRNNFEKKNKAGSIIFPNFKVYYRATEIKAARYHSKNTHGPMEQHRNKLFLLCSFGC